MTGRLAFEGTCYTMQTCLYDSTPSEDLILIGSAVAPGGAPVIKHELHHNLHHQSATVNTYGRTTITVLTTELLLDQHVPAILVETITIATPCAAANSYIKHTAFMSALLVAMASNSGSATSLSRHRL
jgi:hypothetical protein